MSIFLCFIAILIFISTFFMKFQTPNLITRVKLLAFTVFAIGIMSSLFVTINPGKIGVQSLFGKVSSDVLYSGLRMVNPLMKIYEFDIRTQNYTMSGVHDEGS